MGQFQAVEVNYDIQYKRRGQERAIGSGAFGEVRPCTHMGTHKLRAVKTIDKSDWWHTRSQVMREVSVLKAISGRHPNIVEFIEYYEEWSVLNLVFEFCARGSLEDAITTGSITASEAAAAPLMRQLLSALAFLKAEAVLHRDVKPGNVLLTEGGAVRLADFGSACFGPGPFDKAEGTPCMWPPEVLLLPKGKGYSYPVDAWAAGVTLFLFFFKGTHPFDEGKGIDKQLLKGGHFSVGWLTSGRARDLLEWLLLPHPDQRIEPAEALHHGWFAAHGLGDGAFAKPRPAKLALDSRGNWYRSA